MTSTQRKLVWSLGIAQCVSWGIIFYAFSVLLIPMSHDLPMNHSGISFMATLSALVAALVSLPVGRRLDTGDQLGLMTLGSIVAAVGCILWSLADGPALLYCAAILIGLAQASTLYEPVFAFILHAFPQESERNSAMIKVTLIGGLASTIFLPLTTLLIQEFGWRGAIRTLAMVLVIPLAIYAYWRKSASNAAPALVVKSKPLSFDPWSIHKESRRMLMILLAVFLINGIAHTTLTTHLPSALQNWKFGALEASWAVGLMGAMQLVGRIGLGSYLTLVRQHSLLFLPLLTIALALFLLSMFQNSPATWLIVGVIGMFSGLLTLLRPIVVSRLFEKETFGRVSGLLAMSYQLARAGGPVGGAWIIELSQGYEALFWVLSGLISLAAILSIKLRKPSKSQSDPLPKNGGL